ncbi:MAG: glycerophosphodiester phosphodiesterase [Clostridia bacterium]|nr:glycerophosphodiester phosphodiesterase [Clostridia bacterium]
MAKTKKQKALYITAIVLGAVFALYLLFACLPKPQNYAFSNPMLKTGDMPHLVAHGGGNKEFPDNTLEAFYNAYDADSNAMMETDVSITKDGVVILSHDISLDRKTNATGAIADWNYTDLIAQKVDFSYLNSSVENEAFTGTDADRKKFKNDEGVFVAPTDVPGYPQGLPGRDKEVFLATTLEELLVAFPQNRISIEIKQSGETGYRALNAVMQLLEKHNAYGRVVLASFHAEIYKKLQAMQKQNPSLLYSPETGGVVKYFILKTLGLDFFFRNGVGMLQIPTSQMGINLATKSLVKNAHKHNIAVHYWTVDDVEEMKHLIKIGADGITTNYPHRLKQVYETYAK